MSDTATKTPRKRRSSAAVKALKAYKFAEAQEERYLGSVFVTPFGVEKYRARTRAAYEACVMLGLDYKDGL